MSRRPATIVVDAFRGDSSESSVSLPCTPRAAAASQRLQVVAEAQPRSWWGGGARRRARLARRRARSRGASASGRLERPVTHRRRDALVRIAERRPSRTRVSAASVASNRGSEDASASARGRPRARPRAPLAPAGSRTSRREAKTGALSSCRSRSYASGSPLIVASSPGEAADRRPAFPRELRDVRLSFCGIIDDRRRRLRQRGKPNSAVDQSELLADAREVGEQDCRGVEVVEREVAICDGVDRVAHLPVGGG